MKIEADDAAADYREASRDALHLQKRVGIKNVDVVEGDLRWPVRLGARGNENDFAAQAARAAGAGHGHGMRVFEEGLPAY
jgi:hypothetical protein